MRIHLNDTRKGRGMWSKPELCVLYSVKLDHMDLGRTVSQTPHDVHSILPISASFFCLSNFSKQNYITSKAPFSHL